MKITWKQIFWAAWHISMSLILCYALTLVMVEIMKLCGDNIEDVSHEERCFAMFFIAMAISSFYSGLSLIYILIKVKWHGTDRLPNCTEGNITVAFITKEKCLLNGFYDFEQQLFVSYDGLTFRKREVLSWCRDYGMSYFIKYIEYPEKTGF